MPMLRRFEIRAFCDKMRPFCTISASTLWKIDTHTHIYKLILLYLPRIESARRGGAGCVSNYNKRRKLDFEYYNIVSKVSKLQQKGRN